MRRVLTTLMTVGLITVVPGLVGKAYAHGGQYRGPAGEVPPDSREPSDPPPPASPPPTGTPDGDGGGPETGGPGDVGGPPTSGGGDGGSPPTSGGGAPPPSGTGGGPGGVSTKGGKKPGGAAKSPGYEDWTFWWNFNKDEIVQLKSSVKKLQSGVASGTGSHGLGRTRGGGGEAVRTATDAAIQDKIVPALRTLLTQDDLNFDIQSASAIALSKISDDSVIDTLKAMATNDKKGGYQKVVRESAGLAFGLLQKDSEDVRNFLIGLIGDDKLDSSFVRPFSAISLGLLGGTNDRDDAALNALLNIAHSNQSGDVKPAALVALGLLGNEKAVAPLLKMLETGKGAKLDLSTGEDLKDVERAFVVQALGKLGQPGTAAAGQETAVLDAIDGLLSGKKSNKASTNEKRSAAIALGQIGPQCSPKQQTEIVKTLKAIAMGDRDDDSSIRNFATISLGRIGSTKGVEAATRDEAIKALTYVLDKGKPTTIAPPFAALGLGLIGRSLVDEGLPVRDDEINKKIRDMFEETKDPRSRGSYAIALGMMRDKLCIPALKSVLAEKGDSKLRGYSAVALGMIGSDECRDAIKTALTTDTDRDLRVQTAVAAGLIGDASVIKNLVDILESAEDSQYILGSVALSLGQIGDDRSIEPLVNIALDQVKGKSFPDLTRALATVALGQIGDRRDLPVLSRVARDFNYRAHVPAMAELLTIL